MCGFFMLFSVLNMFLHYDIMKLLNKTKYVTKFVCVFMRTASSVHIFILGGKNLIYILFKTNVEFKGENIL